ncbi:polysaccharide deacetylase family protein [Phocaeicola paurosaccharolyticus]|jgi:peptidoglycan-N-acetylglucosamine deacetylase|uniref:polysaccharide deacetylase family protein n=1 Tax=Phocaeicola paurosaccharolyticus TaxID=732242 RepID=UPI0004696E6A|nr:polysaccharide deacetylase family protein [Phocaeicola paurosaccharolyticus]
MLIEQPPLILRWLYPKALWRMDRNDKSVYLTFDDGPIPEITPWVLDLLDKYQIKATFFLVGDNVRKHPEEFKMILERGHRVGNHTFNHIRGFEYLSENYLANTDKANELIKSDLFRPPHGHMRWVQYYTLRDKYRIVMWDLVTRDYSKRLNGFDVFLKVKKYVRNGSIITFHDSLKSEKNLKYALPRSIEWLLKEGYTFKVFD